MLDKAVDSDSPRFFGGRAGEEGEASEAVEDFGPRVFDGASGQAFWGEGAEEGFEPGEGYGVGWEECGVFEGLAFGVGEFVEDGAQDGGQAAFGVVAAEGGAFVVCEGVEAGRQDRLVGGSFVHLQVRGYQFYCQGEASQSLDDCAGGFCFGGGVESAVLFEEG
jgi:hypothetical protein